MMLHHPFHEVSEVLGFDGNEHATYLEAFEACEATCMHEDYDYYGVDIMPPKDTDEFEDRDDPPDVEAGD